MEAWRPNTANSPSRDHFAETCTQPFTIVSLLPQATFLSQQKCKALEHARTHTHSKFTRRLKTSTQTERTPECVFFCMDINIFCHQKKKRAADWDTIPNRCHQQNDSQAPRNPDF
jgi:hypothetical protein